jgi:hypothetical protein
MRSLLIVALLATASCSRNPSVESLSPNPNRKLAVRVLDYVGTIAWRASGYDQLNEVETPVTLVLASDQTACAIMAVDATPDPIRAGNHYTCKTPWRRRHVR